MGTRQDPCPRHSSPVMRLNTQSPFATLEFQGWAKSALHKSLRDWSAVSLREHGTAELIDDEENHICTPLY